MKMSNDTYDFLKYMAQIVIPALATLVVTLGKIWGFPLGEEVSGTLMALDLFLGALLKVSTDKYWEEEQDEE